MKDQLNAIDGIGGNVGKNGGLADSLLLAGRYEFECRDADGNLKWTDHIDNLVTTVGKNDLLDKYLSGSGYTAAFFMGLKGTGTAVIGDTAASHAGWLEVGGANAPAYSQGTRQGPTFAAASGGSKATSAAVSFSMTSAGTVAGAFLTTVSTKDNGTGVLFSAGDFSGGSKTVANGDTLTATYSLAV